MRAQRAAQARPAQDPGPRRRVHPRRAQHRGHRRGGHGPRRGVVRDGPPAGPRGGDALRDLLRRGGRRGDPGRLPPRERRQAARRRPARPRRALSLHAACSPSEHAPGRSGPALPPTMAPRARAVERDITPTRPSSRPWRSRATSTTRWSRTACARRRWNAAASWAGVAPRVSSFHPLRNAAASETRYDADPHDLIDAVVDAPRARGRDPGDLPLAPALGGRPQPDRPAREPLRASPPDHRLAPRRVPGRPRLAARPRLVRGTRLADRRARAAGRDDAAHRLRLHSRRGRTTLRTVIDHHNSSRRPSSSMQRTLIIFKPDCVQRRLVGTILQRFEAKGLRIAALKLIHVDRALGEKHYAEHQGKPFFEGLIEFITGGAGGRRRAGRERGDRGRPDHARRDQRRRRRARDDPRRLLDQQAEQPGPRQRQPRVGRARDRALVPARGARSTTRSTARTGSSAGREPPRLEPVDDSTPSMQVGPTP